MVLYCKDFPVFFGGEVGGLEKNKNWKKLFVTSLDSESGKNLKRENDIIFLWSKKKIFRYSQSNEFHQYYGAIFIC